MTVKGLVSLRVNLPPVYHTRWRIHTVPLIAECKSCNVNLQSKTAFFKDTDFSKNGNDSSNAIKAILEFCTTNKLFEFNNVFS